MSSFLNRHHMYLFSMKNGRKKLAYGETPIDALEILASRLSEKEMEEINKEDFIRIKQQEIHKYTDMMG